MANASQALIKFEWFWKSNDDPWSSSEPEEWSRFSDVEMAIIEEALQKKLPDVLLDSYHINFKHMVQISNKNENNQRPVKRVVNERKESRLREARFMPNPVNPSRPFSDWDSSSSFNFMVAVQKYFDLEHRRGLHDAEVRQWFVDKAAEGFIMEGKRVSKTKEANWMAKELLKTKYADQVQVWNCCVRLYCMESFLYKKLNEAMRLSGDEEHEELLMSRVPTFGPFVYLLQRLEHDHEGKDQTVYRGANLSEDQIEQYRQLSLDPYNIAYFPAFTSTSRNRKKAEEFGNVLFIIDIFEKDGEDVSLYSNYPSEEEQLLDPRFRFSVHSCIFDEIDNKWEIYLTK
ncbi:unnamed protein product [Rotaria socialis]|uniref:NAD(P)(+)--arginine ADP-ribosyltransferase n=1 Tax=Rotaria socialis TaxID=392032 RepID=A0A820Q5V5_9BILA|nr:unnamed protein product [Rotaria socialis]CAF4417688.1 unnamed protein product [Rotaria socialis]